MKLLIIKDDHNNKEYYTLFKDKESLNKFLDENEETLVKLNDQLYYDSMFQNLYIIKEIEFAN